jgi:hypothetical protein
MTDATNLSETDAIRQVITEGGAMDYIDVVEAVRKKYGLNVSSGLVEQVHLQMRQASKYDIQPRIKLELGRPRQPEDAARGQSVDVGGDVDIGGGESCPPDHLALALRFVKSVHGLQNAHRALRELEAILHELKE